MTRLTDNDGREFTVTRTPQVESARHPSFLDRYPVLCLLASCTAGLALVIAALAWILSHDGCSRPIGAVVAVLLLAVGGVCAFAPLLMLAASDAPWLFPEDSERE